MIKKIKLNNLSVFFLIVGFCALRKITVLMYLAQLLFLFCCASRLSKNPKLRFDGYTKAYLLFGIFAISSIGWSASTSQCVSALKPLLQLTVIGILLNDYIDDEYKMNSVWKYFMYSSVILIVFLFAITPPSVWTAAMKVSTNASSAADRIGPSIGFQPNWMGLICAFSIMLWVYNLSRNDANKKFSFLMIMVLAVIVIFTKSRKALIVLLMGPTLFWLLYKPRKKSIIIIVPLAILAIVAAIWAVFNVPFLYKMIGFRLIGLFGMFDSSIVVDASTRTRANMVQIGLELFKKNPVVGVGFGNFSYHYFYEYSGWAQTYAHNNYVEILAVTGTVGFILYYAVPFMMLFRMATRWKRYAAYDRKLAAFLITFIIIRLVMDYGMVDYDDEFVQILTVNCFAAIRIMDQNIFKLRTYNTEEA